MTLDSLFGLVQRAWWGGDPDEKHEVSNMSRRDVYCVQKTWKNMYANASANGFLLFVRLFRKDPESQSFFGYIATATEEELAASPAFKAHVINIMASLNSAVANLHQPEVVVPLMQRLGQSHHRRNIRRKQFMYLRDVLVTILKDDLKLGPEVIESWEHFVDFIYQHIFAALTE